MNYVWDCFQHAFKMKNFEPIHYLDNKSLDEIFNTILYILDDEIEQINDDEIDEIEGIQ